MTNYDNGDLVRCTAVFTNFGGNRHQPDHRSVLVQSIRRGRHDVHSTGLDAQFVKSATGNYYVDVNAIVGRGLELPLLLNRIRTGGV
jgi:hypothetical protein